MPSTRAQIDQHLQDLRKCTRCANMIGPVVTGNSVFSPLMLIGQAPGQHEGAARKPFAWTAGKTLFGWFREIGLDEDVFRRRVYMSAVCRCFPGKNPNGGDRVPSSEEISNCSTWLKAEIQMLSPQMIIPVGKLAIQQLIPVTRLNDVVGVNHRITVYGVTTDVIPLPHPSGASPWHRIEPGKRLLGQALRIIREHRAWKSLCEQEG